LVRIGERRPTGGGEVLEQPAVSTDLDPRDLWRGAPLQHGRPWVSAVTRRGESSAARALRGTTTPHRQSAPAMSACAALDHSRTDPHRIGGVGTGSAGSDGFGRAGADGRRFCPTTPGAGAGAGAVETPRDEICGSSSTSGGSSSTSAVPLPPPVNRRPLAGPACACGFDSAPPGCGLGLASPPGAGELVGPRAG